MTNFDETKLLLNDNGDKVLPKSVDDWKSWISASRTRSYSINDPVLDWLDLHGKDAGFLPDKMTPSYDPMYDWTTFIFQKGNEFEDVYIENLKEYAEVKTIGDFRVARSLEKAKETVSAMENGVEVITQAVLRNPENCTYGLADLMIRLDVLLQAKELFPNAFDIENQSGIDLKDPNVLKMYRIVDIKFSTLDLKRGDLLSSKQKPYMVQLDIYNRAMGRLQGYTPKFTYVAGRKWRQGKLRGNSATDKLGVINVMGDVTKGNSLKKLTDESIRWRKDVQVNGGDWKIFPKPDRIELYPDTGNVNSGWDKAKSIISWKLKDLTRVSHISPTKRRKGHQAGITALDDPRLDSNVLGISGKHGILVDEIIKINRMDVDDVVRPKKIRSGEEVWRNSGFFEFFVDFETVSDLDDDFKNFPKSGGQSLIFQIGCGYYDGGSWYFKQFTVKWLDKESELEILDEWFSYMNIVSEGKKSMVYHWSGAEPVHIETAYDNARKRHPERSWPNVNWFDLFKNVFDAEPVVVKGAYGLGLKQIARALKRHGFLTTTWGSGPADGMGAMIGAWRANSMAREEGGYMIDFKVMGLIEQYNEIDCKVMQEILSYLRKNH
ncbi:ribonuclease H-like domain-containing protein [Dehalococcoidia bacterium]|nr:ribonuclease H-like domain-containing protein [Dehalococcoidia bacterium]